jgi:hypothetical protein
VSDYACLSIYNKIKTMEKFYLIIIKNDGTIIHDIFATSHKDLINKHLNADDIRKNNYFKARFSPKEESRLDDVDSYQIIIDETFVPEWFYGSLAEDVNNELKKIIESMIIKGRKKLLLHEGVILTKRSIVDEVKHSIIFAMYDDSKINVIDNASEIHLMTDDTIVEEMLDGSKIIEMFGFSKVRKMKDYSKILKMYGQAKVGEMYDHSRIAMLKGYSNIMEMHDDAQADRLKHMSRVDEMHNHSVIEELWDWSVVEKMFDHSRINYMDEDSKVLEMYGNSMIEEMCGNSIVEKLYENSLVRKLHEKAQILSKEL